MNFEQVISLGRDCQTAFQIRRYFGENACPKAVFDFQVTPPAAVVDYIEHDFRGMFERGDLAFNDAGQVVNTRYSTKHLHEFADDIDAAYEQSRSRHDYLCGKLRRILDGDTPTLFVLKQRVGGVEHLRIDKAIRNRNPRLRFHLLVVDDAPNLPPTRPHPEDWEGNDDHWDQAFAPFKVWPRPTTHRILDNPVAFARGQLTRLGDHIRAMKF